MSFERSTQPEQNDKRAQAPGGAAGAGMIVSDTVPAAGAAHDGGPAETSGPTDADTSDELLHEAARISSRARDSLPELVKGDRLGRYLIVSPLGKGGMGFVYAAEDTKLGRMIALKVLATDGKDQRARFLREAQSVAAVEHNNIATIHDYGEDEGRVFLAMELVRGESLDKRLRRSALPISEVARIAREIARGLATAHARGIVHRDIKPGNVMISDENNIKLLDFGLAKRADCGDPPLTVEKSVIGTTGYMSPEQTKGERVDARTDVFSFGVMLYEMVTGRRPFEGRSTVEINTAILRDEPPPPSSVNPSTPPEIDSIVKRCLQKDAAARYADAGEVLKELELPLSAAPESRPAASAPKPEPRAAGPTGRGRWALVIAGAVVVAGLALGWRVRAGAPPVSTPPARGPELAAASTATATSAPGPSPTGSASPGPSAAPSVLPTSMTAVTASPTTTVAPGAGPRPPPPRPKVDAPPVLHPVLPP